MFNLKTTMQPSDMREFYVEVNEVAKPMSPCPGVMCPAEFMKNWIYDQIVKKRPSWNIKRVFYKEGGKEIEWTNWRF